MKRVITLKLTEEESGLWSSAFCPAAVHKNKPCTLFYTETTDKWKFGEHVNFEELDEKGHRKHTGSVLKSDIHLNTKTIFATDNSVAVSLAVVFCSY